MTRDRFAIMRHLLTGPLTLVIYLLYAFGMTVHNRLTGWKQKAWYWTYGVCFYVLDVLYNWTVGTFIWWEFPRETLFTTRLERKVKEEGSQLGCVLCKYLSVYDPDHCRLEEG